MRYTVSYGRTLVALAVPWGVLLAWPSAGAAQTLTGQAISARATLTSLLGSTTTTLADTGKLSGPADARRASQLTGSIPLLLTGETLHGVTIGWPDQVASEAGLTGLSLGLTGISISADLVMARVLALLDGAYTGISSIDRLSVNGVPITVTGAPNQTIYVPGGVLVINEQLTSSASTVVNALHLTVDGVADVVIASATAGIQ